MNIFSNRKLYIYSNSISMRLGIKKAQILVYLNFSPVEVSKSIFIFVSKSRKQIKIYYEDDYGYWLSQNKLAFKKFKLPDEEIKSLELKPKELQMFLKGLEVIESKKKPENNGHVF